MTPLAERFAGQLPRLVMFDLDGTLLDSVPDLALAVDRMLAQLGRASAGVEQVRDWVGNGSLTLVRRALAGAQEHAQVDPAEAAAAHQLFLQAYAQCHDRSRVYPGVLECLHWLLAQGIPMGLVTNKPFRFIAPLLARHGLAGYFNWVLAVTVCRSKNRIRRRCCGCSVRLPLSRCRRCLLATRAAMSWRLAPPGCLAWP